MTLSPTFGQSGRTVCLGEGFGLGFNLSQSSPRTRLSSNGMPACTSSSLRNSARLLAFNLSPIPDHNLVDHSHVMSAKVTDLHSHPLLSKNSCYLPYKASKLIVQSGLEAVFSEASCLVPYSHSKLKELEYLPNILYTSFCLFASFGVLGFLCLTSYMNLPSALERSTSWCGRGRPRTVPRCAARRRTGTAGRATPCGAGTWSTAGARVRSCAACH